MNAGPSVTAIIPALNASRNIDAVVRAVRSQTGIPSAPAIVVVDDGSTDDTAAVARKAGAVVLTQPNRGPAAARNHGWREHGKGELVWFLDADCFPAPDALAILLAALDSPSIGAAGGSYTNARTESALARIVQAEIAMRHARMGPEVRFLGSYHLLVRREVLESTGGFDESYRAASGEDNDFSYRIRKLGHRLRFAPGSRVAHLHPVNVFVYWKEQCRHGEWRMKLYRDHPGEARGDDYSGPFDFLEPPLALVTAMAILAAPFAWSGEARVALAAPLLLATLLALAVPAAWRIGRREGAAAGLIYMGLRPVRAAARGVGMVRGIARYWFPGGRER
ncbi:MAG: glycosyltransferase [Gemmatimonadetes bacterium]|nr:glycosyltransferase [Gemmatimonadota bacterium]